MIDAGRIASFGLAAAAAFALAANTHVESFHYARLGIALLALLALHSLRFASFVFVREAAIYSAFLGYMLIELLWTGDRLLALNTIVPAATFVIVLVLFASLAVYHDLKSVLAGAICGFLAGAALYTRISGFPFKYPVDFSYNAIASMYHFGLIVTLLLASVGKRKGMLFALAAVIGVHVVATTSIKTNLGILLGALVAGVIHFADLSRLIWRNALIILAVTAVLGIAVATNEAAVEQIQRGADRVALGMQILKSREDRPGYGSLEQRASWQREGFRGLSENPMFGHGVEAFRSEFKTTSHASHVDIAYNSGLIGILLFYGVFASMFLRIYRARHAGLKYSRLVILGSVISYLFISLAGTIHYSALLAAVLALSIGILKRA